MSVAEKFQILLGLYEITIAKTSNLSTEQLLEYYKSYIEFTEALDNHIFKIYDILREGEDK